MKLTEIYEIIREHEPGIVERHRHFSVLIPLVERGGETSLLYQVRGSDIKRQPGEISFPGGAMEQGESFLECAVRETCEELCIEPDDIRDVVPVGMHNTWTGDKIHIYAGSIAGDVVDSCSPSRIEVSELFEVPVSWLISHEPDVFRAIAVPDFEEEVDEGRLGFPDGYPWRRIKSEVPVYYYDDHAIWGITGRITKYFISILKGEK